MIESIIDAKGQTTLPKAVREALSVQPGDRVRYFIHQDGGVKIMAVRPIGRLFGMLNHDGPTVTLGACPRIRSWRRKTPRNSLFTAL